MKKRKISHIRAIANLLDFAYTIQEYIEQGYHVALCDSAFSNGGDIQVIGYLDELNVLDKLNRLCRMEYKL